MDDEGLLGRRAPARSTGEIPRFDGQAYAELHTPDDGYNVGIDAPSALHPQTMLAYEMNGEALSSDHGAPLRLVIPVKYGLKWLKRVGTRRFSDTRLDDFWTKRGYDWYAGL